MTTLGPVAVAGAAAGAVAGAAELESAPAGDGTAAAAAPTAWAVESLPTWDAGEAAGEAAWEPGRGAAGSVAQKEWWKLKGRVLQR